MNFVKHAKIDIDITCLQIANSTSLQVLARYFAEKRRGGFFKCGRPLFLAKKTFEFFEIYSVSTRRGGGV